MANENNRPKAKIIEIKCAETAYAADCPTCGKTKILEGIDIRTGWAICKNWKCNQSFDLVK